MFVPLYPEAHPSHIVSSYFGRNEGAQGIVAGLLLVEIRPPLPSACPLTTWLCRARGHDRFDRFMKIARHNENESSSEREQSLIHVVGLPDEGDPQLVREEVLS